MSRIYRRPFEPLTRYFIHLCSRDLVIGDIPYLRLIELVRSDGRIFGILADPYLASYFDNFELSRNGASYDLLEHPVHGGARSWEVKTASYQKPVSLEQSGHKGMGREWKESEHFARLKGLYGYILVDVAHLPELRIFGFPMSYAQEYKWVRSISRKDIDNIFSPNMFTATVADR